MYPLWIVTWWSWKAYIFRGILRNRNCKIFPVALELPTITAFLLTPARGLVHNFIWWDLVGEDGNNLVDISFGPSVADYFTRLTDAYKVTKYLCSKTKTKDYKGAIIYVPLVLPLTKKCSIVEGSLENPDVISYLIKRQPLAKRWALSRWVPFR